jgi:hypothetical protein
MTLQFDFILRPLHWAEKYEFKVLKIIWLFLPAAFANMAPVVAKFMFPKWNQAIDFGHRWRNKKIFGSHKTYRGFFAAILAGFLVFRLQQLITDYVPWMRWFSLIDYSFTSPFFGAWMGFCAISADLVKSFFKRRLQISPGESWIPFDEMDWISGSLLGMCVLFIPTAKFVLATLLVFTILDFLINWIAVKFELKEKIL